MAIVRYKPTQHFTDRYWYLKQNVGFNPVTKLDYQFLPAFSQLQLLAFNTCNYRLKD